MKIAKKKEYESLALANATSQMNDCLNALRLLSSSLFIPEQAVDMIVGHHTRETITCLNVMRDEFGLSPVCNNKTQESMDDLRESLKLTIENCIREHLEQETDQERAIQMAAEEIAYMLLRPIA